MPEKLRCIDGGQKVRPQEIMDELIDCAARGLTAYITYKPDEEGITRVQSIHPSLPGWEPKLPDDPELLIHRLTPAEALPLAQEVALGIAEQSPTLLSLAS